MKESSGPPIPGYSIYDPVDPFENLAGPFYWTDNADGLTQFAVEAAVRHCNSQGVVHGGFLMTMIDLTLVAVAKQAPEDKFVTVSLNSDFVGSALKGELLMASGELVRRTRSMAFVRGQIASADRILLTANAVLKLIKPRNAS